jgi:hypothetical protein
MQTKFALFIWKVLLLTTKPLDFLKPTAATVTRSQADTELT